MDREQVSRSLEWCRAQRLMAQTALADIESGGWSFSERDGDGPWRDTTEDTAAMHRQLVERMDNYIAGYERWLAGPEPI